MNKHIDILITAIIPLCLLLSIIYPIFMGWGGGKLLIDNKLRLLNKDTTDTLKGLAAIIVILVHIPEKYTNALQDAMGSFAFVGVTFFFLVSAYGMQLSITKKSDYMHSFWRNRLVALLIPMLLVNITGVILSYLKAGEFKVSSLLYINGYVKVLLLYCLWFWLVWFIGSKAKVSQTIMNIILMGGVTVSSLYLYFFVYANADAGWCFERMGLVWGLLLFMYFPLILKWMEEKHMMKTCVFLLLGLIVGYLYIKHKTVYFIGEYLLKVVLGLVLLTALFITTKKFKIGNKVTLFLGSISYEIYLCHGMVMATLSHYSEGLSSGIFVLLTVICSITLAFVLNSIGSPIVKKLRAKPNTKAIIA